MKWEKLEGEREIIERRDNMKRKERESIYI